MEINNNVKIGSRALSEYQLGQLLPNYKEIYNRINIMREHARKCNNDVSTKNEGFLTQELNKELNRNYNNVFSILGGRGSGKTSVLLTIKNKLTNNVKTNNLDIMLPLIIPENMGEVSDILGWTICAFENIIADIEEYAYRNNRCEREDKFEFYKNCRKNDNNEIRQKYKELIKYYTYVKDEYRQILINTYDGFNNYRDKTKEVVNAERELLNRFEEFIKKIIEVKKELYNNEEEPLIYIFFDDIDLTTGRCLEIVNMILKYLSNPNIVIFVAGDYSTFTEALTINLLRKDDLLQNTKEYFSNSSQTVLEKRKLLSQDILKKALPPAYRFYMPTLNVDAKVKFTYSTHEDDERIEDVRNKETNKVYKKSNYNTLLELINIKLMYGENVNTSKSDVNTNSFLYYNNNLIDIYFNIFDSNPRGLMNVYYFLYSLNDDQNYYNILQEFLKIIIDSNPDLGDMREEILTIVDIKENLSEIFIDYDYLLELSINKDSMPSNDKIDKYINIFLLAHFIENLIVIYLNNKSKENRKVHGLNVFIQMVNMKNGYSLLPKYDSGDGFVLALYSELINKIKINTKEQFEGYTLNYFTKTYFEILYKLTYEGKDLENLFSKIIRKDQSWVKSITEMLYRITCKDSDLLVRRINEISKFINIDSLGPSGKEELILNLKELYNDYKYVPFSKISKVVRQKYNVKVEQKLDEILNINEDSLEFNYSFFKGQSYEVSKELKNKLYDMITESEKYNSGLITNKLKGISRLIESGNIEKEKYEIIKSRTLDIITYCNRNYETLELRKEADELYHMIYQLSFSNFNKNYIEEFYEIIDGQFQSDKELVGLIKENYDEIIYNENEEEREVNLYDSNFRMQITKDLIEDIKYNILIKTYMDYDERKNQDKDISSQVNEMKECLDNTKTKLLMKEIYSANSKISKIMIK